MYSKNQKKLRGILKILVTDWCKVITPTTLTV